MSEPPIRSSGANWTPEEDDRLFEELKALTLKFEGRSIWAVLARIAVVKDYWWVRDKRAREAEKTYERIARKRGEIE